MKRTVSSMSNPDVQYEIDDEKLTCSCPAFRLGMTRPCKHLKALPELKGRLAKRQYEPPSDTLASEYKIAKYLKGKTEMGDVYSVGHSNHTIERFTELLEQYEIKTLVDVRSRPYSKYNKHFSRQPLREHVEGYGIKYLWGGKWLGGLSKMSVENQIFIMKMDQIEELTKAGNVAMMCSEGDPATCHRAFKLASYRLRTDGLDTTHILTSGATIDAETLEASLKSKFIWHEYGGEQDGS